MLTTLLPDAKADSLPFSRSEFAVRGARTRQAMAARGIDTLIVVSPENMNYLTGYDGWSFYTPQCVIIRQSDDMPIWIGRAMDVGCAAFTTWLPDTHLHGYPESMIANPHVHPMQFMAEQLRALGCGSDRIGIERDIYYHSARADDAVRSALPGAQFIDATGLINRLRCIKSENEIAYLREAGVMAMAAMDSAVGAMAPGVRECDAVAEVFRTLVRGTDTAGGDVPWFPYMPTGARTATPHLTWTDAPFVAGHPVNIELGGCRKRYSAGLSRTIALGGPGPGLSTLAAIVDDGFQQILDAMRAGQRCCDVEAVWRAHIGRHGLTKDSRIGYSIGLAYPPTWVEQSASLQRDDETVLTPNMVFHIITGMWNEGDSYVYSETVRVTEDGHERLTPYPFGMVRR